MVACLPEFHPASYSNYLVPLTVTSQLIFNFKFVYKTSAACWTLNDLILGKLSPKINCCICCEGGGAQWEKKAPMYALGNLVSEHAYSKT